MVRLVFLLFIILNTNCKTIKEQTEKNSTSNLKLAFSFPEKAKLGDTIDVNIILINRSSEKITFFEPCYIGMMEHTIVFRQALIIELLEKQLNEIERIIEIKEFDSLSYFFKVPIDSTFYGGKIPFQVVFITVPPENKSKNKVKYYGNLVSTVDTIEVE